MNLILQILITEELIFTITLIIDYFQLGGKTFRLTPGIYNEALFHCMRAQHKRLYALSVALCYMCKSIDYKCNIDVLEYFVTYNINIIFIIFSCTYSRR